MAKFQLQIETEHALLFLYDPTAALGDTPPDLRYKLAEISKNGVSFCVLHYEDGASVVTISDKDCDLGGSQFAHGTIETPGGVLALTDSYNFTYINVPVPEGAQNVGVWADAGTNPTWIWVKLDKIREC
jgi:hypothetical protein